MTYVEIIDAEGNTVFGKCYDSQEEAKDDYNMLCEIDLKIKVIMMDGTTMIEMSDRRGCATVDEILDELEANECVILCNKEGTPYITGRASELQICLHSYVLDRKAIKVGRKIKIF